MTKPYDDGEYLRWTIKLQDLVTDFLDTEGNTPDTLRQEVETAIDNFEPDEEGASVERPPKR